MAVPFGFSIEVGKFRVVVARVNSITGVRRRAQLFDTETQECDEVPQELAYFDGWNEPPGMFQRSTTRFVAAFLIKAQHLIPSTQEGERIERMVRDAIDVAAG